MGVFAHRHGATLVIEGALSGEEARALDDALQAAEDGAPSGPLRLDLDGLELTDGVAVAIAVTAIRGLLLRRGALTLVAPGQMLAHTLYRVGALEDGRLKVENVQHEEPTTAN